MAIDWDDNTKRKIFREALQEAYPSEAELAMFVDEELNENLETIAGGINLQDIAYNLVRWAKAHGRLDEVYKVFKAQKFNHPAITKLERSALVPRCFNLTQDDWDKLFTQFFADDVADLQRAFQKAFEKALGISFRRVQPQHPSIVEVTQIRELLESYDADEKGPFLAVWFVEFAIAELQRSSEEKDRDLSGLAQWRDRIAHRHNVPAISSESTLPTDCHAYLLVVLEEMGSDVNVYPELHIAGERHSIEFGATPTTCAVSNVVDQISQWIKQAEEALESRQCEEEVILELFLPCKYLDEDVAMTWKVKDKRNDEIALGNHRRFLVRSTERIRDRQIQRLLDRKWQRLEACVRAGDGCGQFHLQESCPDQKGDLCALLKDCNATGLKLIARLPSDSGKRTDLLNEIIDAAIPIALWSSETTETDQEGLKTEFDSLLRQCHLTNFADLARQWRRRRIDSVPARQIKLLCDRPDRIPKIPDPTQEEDLLVAS